LNYDDLDTFGEQIINAFQIQNKHNVMSFVINQIVKMMMSYEDKSAVKQLHDENICKKFPKKKW